MCFGPAYFVAPAAVRQLVEAHEKGNYPVLPLEDVYVTGKGSSINDVTVLGVKVFVTAVLRPY